MMHKLRGYRYTKQLHENSNVGKVENENEKKRMKTTNNKLE